MTYRQFETFETVNATTPYTRKSLDLSAFELTGEYKISPKSELELEIEFEHGGTGSAMEFDPFEESGEFENETEKGGEVVLSEFYYFHGFGYQNWIKVGKIPVPISLGNVQENYILYPTIYSSSAEFSMIPKEWRELGIEYLKRFDSGFNVKLLLTSGLNSEFFRKYNWAGGGYQTQFETVNADNLAGSAVIEYGDVATSDGIAAAVYYGDTAGNRHKLKKLNDSAMLLISSIYGRWAWGDFGLRGQVIHGTLSNSDKVSAANATLAGNAGPGAFGPLGHEAQLEMAEASYQIYSDDDSGLKAFLGYEHVDTMVSVEGAILKDDRYNQVLSSFGFMQTWEKILFVKAQYIKHSNALTGIPATNDIQVAFGFDWYGFNL